MNEQIALTGLNGWLRVYLLLLTASMLLLDGERRLDEPRGEAAARGARIARSVTGRLRPGRPSTRTFCGPGAVKTKRCTLSVSLVSCVILSCSSLYPRKMHAWKDKLICL